MKRNRLIYTIRRIIAFDSLIIYLLLGILFVFVLNWAYEDIKDPLADLSTRVIYVHYLVVLFAFTLSSYIIDRIFNEIKWLFRTMQSFIIIRSILITVVVGCFIYLHIYILWSIHVHGPTGFSKFMSDIHLFTKESDIHLLTQESVILLVLTFILSLLINIILFTSRVIGTRVFFGLIFSIYKKPVTLKRLILQLKLKDAKSIMEQLGEERFLKFEQDFFKDVSLAARESFGILYQYSHTQNITIISWKYHRGKKHNNCYKMFFLIKHIISSREKFYMNKYGIAPDFIASIHCGNILIGMLGVNRILLSFQGNILVEGKHIVEQCINLNQSLLITQEAIQVLGKSKQLDYEDCGELKSNEDKNAIQIFGIRQKAA